MKVNLLCIKGLRKVQERGTKVSTRRLRRARRFYEFVKVDKYVSLQEVSM